jgi:hypothetical protein
LEHLDYLPVAVQYAKQLSRADSAYPSVAVTEKSDVRSKPAQAP